MDKKFKGIYNKASNRAKWWDYSNNGTYFITICTKDMYHYFGYIYQEQMFLNTLGLSVLKCWNNIPKYHPYVVLNAFIVMPNHVHGIIHIDKNLKEETNYDQQKKEFKTLPGSLGSIIRGFKVGVKNEARRLGIQFFWKSNYHDHIIKTAKAHQYIANYIYTNPALWKKDRFYG